MDIVVLVIGCLLHVSVGGQQWQRRHGSTYEYFFSSAEANWFNACSDCESRHAELASVYSEVEHKWLQEKKQDEEYWIGIRNPYAKSGGNDDVWAWSDGSNVPYTAWDGRDVYVLNIGEPDDNGDVCGFYGESSGSGWHDTKCTEVRRYVCKRDFDPCMSNLCEKNARCIPKQDGYSCRCGHDFLGEYCAAGWRKREDSRYEYLFSTADIEEMTWFQSRGFCLEQNADLASIHSDKEHEWIKSERDDKGYWIGLSNADAENNQTWVWSDNSTTDFRRWATAQDTGISGDEPNGEGKICVRYGRSSHEDWFDAKCTFHYRFICKREITGVSTCRSGQCHNNAECIAKATSFTCKCQPGFTGELCERQEITGVSTCLSGPCQNDGECIAKTTSFTCKCQPGFTGELCELQEEITGGSICLSGTCQNDGECIAKATSFTCKCQPGFTGELCELQEGAGMNYVLVLVLCAVALLCLIAGSLIAVLVVRHCRRKRSKSEKGLTTELGTMGHKPDAVGGYTRNDSHLSMTDNEVYEGSPLNSPERYPHGGELYTASSKWPAKGSDAKVKVINDNKGSDALYEKEQPVFSFDREQIATYSERSGSKERQASDSSLYSKEEPVTKVRVPSDSSLYAKERPVDDPSSTYYSTPISVVKPATVSPTQSEGPLYSRER